MRNKVVKKIGVALIFGLLFGMGVNFFLAPTKLYASGVAGAAQLIAFAFGGKGGFFTSTAFWNFSINLPLILLSWKSLGKEFTLFTLLTVSSSTLFLGILPEIQVTNNLILSAIFGGVLTGIGTGLCLRYGFSTGGVDIVALIVQKFKDKSVGKLGMLVNGCILLIAGLVYGWELALASLLSIYIGTKMIDAFYIQQFKATMTIYTQKPEEIIEELTKRSTRGITVLENAYGAFSKTQVSCLTTVVTKYEVYFIKRIIQQIDPDVFVNIQPTIEVVGKYDPSMY
ncbi:YitT family protein [Vagococcus fluvialis]|uniref:YitT family protein n=1 Tax=Vagococcus fluvialis TaxID=2738 RepID=UPI003D118352